MVVSPCGWASTLCGQAPLGYQALLPDTRLRLSCPWLVPPPTEMVWLILIIWQMMLYGCVFQVVVCLF